MIEQDGAGGYTRDNYIVLIDRIKTAPQYFADQLVAHETFPYTHPEQSRRYPSRQLRHLHHQREEDGLYHGDIYKRWKKSANNNLPY